ncbi:unnamed protein product, partial [Mesorhabditis belari]|uniref:E1 ubiquitin-activating enzyme n=1 Tax=Mesorhabditis belari TaxID=2138241 RepID=A0AAF3J4Z9_9BILA
MCKATEESNGNQEQLDTNLYSRQIYALGESAMKNLRQSSVLISGIGGVGVEIAKNLILGGIRHVKIHDQKEATWYDLSAQYFLREEDIGKNRATASFARLAELNDSVTCTLNTDPLTEELIKNFDLIILTDTPLALQLEISQWIRRHGKKMIVAEARGLFSYIFADLGERFCVLDPNGEKVREFYINGVDRISGEVFTQEPHGLMNGDSVVFSEIKGMNQLNDCQALPITVKGPSVFNIGDVAKDFNDYTEGGRGKQVKMPIYLDYKPLSKAIEEPEIMPWDFAKMDYPNQLHLLFQALHRMEEKHDRTPRPKNDVDVDLLQNELPENSGVDKDLLKMFSYGARGNLVNICSVVGGIAAQEVMKTITHHMTPLKQYLYLDHSDALPGDWSSFDTAKLKAQDCSARDHRYDGQATIFGWEYQEELANRKLFIVGSGAIGCELLKNLAMMGVACGKNGLIKITDMDQIETSNLNRQFLFRKTDVGQKKSVCAARAVKAFNPAVNIEAMSERVCPETEPIFNDEFFGGLHCVLNALDNVEARRYVDQQCVFYGLPLLESGTLGTKGNVQVVYPHLTESYSASPDPPEQTIPYCTLKNFPTEIHHTIQWARDKFEALYTQAAELANRYLNDQDAFFRYLESSEPRISDGQKAEMLTAVLKALDSERPSAPEDCVTWARKLFEEYFHDTIAQMLHLFPPEHLTKNGQRFWGGAKRCPHALRFDANKDVHLDFIFAASFIRSQEYNMKPITDRERVAQIANSVQFTEFVPKSGVKIATNDEEAREFERPGAQDLLQDTEALIERLKKLKPDLPALNHIDFEKDDDRNQHIMFITSCSNLRAENYDIESADFFKTKGIAGRIIPAIATTTAAVSGLVCVEFLKTIDANGCLAKTPIERLKNGFINLSLPLTCFSQPTGAPRKKYNDKPWTVWDSLEVRAPMTTQQLIQWVENEVGQGSVVSIGYGVASIYTSFMTPAKKTARLPMDLRKAIEEVTQKAIPSHKKSLIIDVLIEKENDDNDMLVDEDGYIDIPYTQYFGDAFHSYQYQYIESTIPVSNQFSTHAYQWQSKNHGNVHIFSRSPFSTFEIVMEKFNLTNFLIKCMEIESTTGDEGKFADFLAKFMRDSGWNVVEQLVENERKNLIISLGAMKDIDVVFCSHLDTVSPYIPPKFDGQIFWGRGSNDAKGQISAMISMALDLQKNHEELAKKLGLLFTVGEECGNCGMKKVNELDDLNPKFMIIGEPSENSLGTIQKGGLKVLLNVTGKAGHSSYPGTGESAVHKMVEILADIMKHPWPKNEHGETTFNIGYVNGGEQNFPATWPPKAETIIFFRTVTDTDEIYKQLEILINRRAEIVLLSEIDPEKLHPKPHELADIPTASIPFTTDLCHFWRRDISKGVGRQNKEFVGGAFVYGAGSALTAHADDEHVSLAELEKAVAVYKRLALYTCKASSC